MDIFKLGLRNLVGITLPGALLVLVTCYALLSIIFFFELDVTRLASVQTIGGPALMLTIAFLVSYFVGSVLRLNAADGVDEKSRFLLMRDWMRAQRSVSAANQERLFMYVRCAMLAGKDVAIPNGFDDWVWRAELFPYPAWELRKFSLFHPKEVAQFFKTHQECMCAGLTGQEEGMGRRGKEFFNYCKMAILAALPRLGNAIIEEVYYAEAMVRFYAGIYYALHFSLCFLVPLLACQAVWLALLWGKHSDKEWQLILGSATILICAFFIGMKRTIARRFHTLRLKEVDTVYEAFYLVHKGS
jgi:hypothetical protein